MRYRYQVKGNDPFVAWCCNDDPLAPRAFAYSHFLQAVADKRVYSGDGCCGFDLDGLAAVRTLQLQPSEEEDYEARRRFLGKNATRPCCGRAVDECTITPTWTSPAS